MSDHTAQATEIHRGAEKSHRIVLFLALISVSVKRLKKGARDMKVRTNVKAGPTAVEYQRF
jgi:hypothetical protein